MKGLDEEVSGGGSERRNSVDREIYFLPRREHRTDSILNSKGFNGRSSAGDFYNQADLGLFKSKF